METLFGKLVENLFSGRGEMSPGAILEGVTGPQEPED